MYNLCIEYSRWHNNSQHYKIENYVELFLTFLMTS